jgi:hypothetical protein
MTGFPSLSRFGRAAEGRRKEQVLNLESFTPSMAASRRLDHAKSRRGSNPARLSNLGGGASPTA